MKRLLAVLMALLLCGTALAHAEGADDSALVVASTTRMSGNFFTDMWGNGTSDIDVRALIHGYETVVWDRETSSYIPNRTVVADAVMRPDESGNRTYVLTIREGLTYNDGTPITAADYVFGILLSAAPQVREIGGVTTGYGHLTGFGAYSAGESAAFAGVRLLDEYTLSLTVGSDYLPFFYELSYIHCQPYPISVIAPGCEVADEGEGAFIRNADTGADPLFTAALLRETILGEGGYLSHPAVTSGPYTLESFDGETATFAVNPNFAGDAWGQKPVIERLTYTFVAAEDIAAKLADGTVDLVNKTVAADAITQAMELVAQEQVNTSTYPRTGLSFLSFACEQGPAQDASVRQALALCLDSEQFTSNYTQNYGTPVYAYYGIGQWVLQLVEGTIAPEEATEEELEQIGALSLEDLDRYALDLERAQELLIASGYTLNEQGAEFVPGTDTVRCKQLEDGSLLPLTLKWAKTKNSAAADLIEAMLLPNAAQIGMQIEVTEMPFTDMLTYYYRQQERTYDLFYLASNMSELFDPYASVNTADEYQGVLNTTGIRDERLMQYAWNLRATEPGDYLTYAERWVQFQLYFNEVLPMIPLYSNIYFDFYRTDLQNYAPAEHGTWADAILYAYIGEPAQELPEEPALP